MDRLLRLSHSIDIYVVPADRAAGRTGRRLEWQRPEPTPAREYGEVLGVLALLTAAGWFATPFTGHLAIGLLYLLAVIALSLRVGRWPMLVAGLASALTWNYLIIPPRFKRFAK